MTDIPERFDFDKVRLRGPYIEQAANHYRMLRSDGYHDAAQWIAGCVQWLEALLVAFAEIDGDVLPELSTLQVEDVEIDDDGTVRIIGDPGECD